ncbi:MAG: spermidine synthase [Acidobacteriota bacterium]
MSATRRSEAALCLVFFVSGASALLFETLWFRLAGLTFGNSVWATSMVLASFMGGLALGNFLTGRLAPRLKRPLRAYAAIEAAIGVTGAALVVVFPSLTSAFAPLFRHFLEQPLVLNPLRLGIAFLLMGIPATAMGATLPLLVGTLSKGGGGYGRLLGRLYGWNSLGAVAGALAGETVLIGALGIRGTGLVAGLLNGSAAVVALLVAARIEAGVEEPVQPEMATSLRKSAGALLVAAFLSGAVLLALEVVWFRFLLLFIDATTMAFALMLAVVLFGIALGGLLSASIARAGTAEQWSVVVALACGFAVVAGYASFQPADPAARTALSIAIVDVVLSLRLMLPVCILSGVLFTLVGRALQTRVGDETRSTSQLTFANTIGAMFGTLCGGFVLLPSLGMERSFLVLALLYGVIALILATSQRRAGGRSSGPVGMAMAVSAVLFAGALALFPSGLIRNDLLPRVISPYTKQGAHVLAVREGVTETATYLRKDLWGLPYEYRLVTNGISMSGTSLLARRYMALFVRLPMALHPAAKRALLISYGVGTTAKALTDTSSLQNIDVVDISRTIVEMSRLRQFEGGHPLDDPRVHVHIEDGRFFLLTTPNHYDLITAEPPPLKNAGVVNLYSAEYFQLIHDRLAPGGLVTYWLPIYQLEGSEGKAVIKAFCNVFDDCSLWSGAGPELILMGSRGAVRPSDEEIAAPWRDAVTARALTGIGVPSPELLGTLFIGDAAMLRGLTGDAPPLTDDFPLRLGTRPVTALAREFLPFFDVRAAQTRFATSPYVGRLWPAATREAALPLFRYEAALQKHFVIQEKTSDTREEAGYTLTHTADRSLPLILLGSDALQQRIAEQAWQRGISDPLLDWMLGLGDVADRRYGEGVERLARAAGRAPQNEALERDLNLARSLAGRN